MTFQRTVKSGISLHVCVYMSVRINMRNCVSNVLIKMETGKQTEKHCLSGTVETSPVTQGAFAGTVSRKAMWGGVERNPTTSSWNTGADQCGDPKRAPIALAPDETEVCVYLKRDCFCFLKRLKIFGVIWELPRGLQDAASLKYFYSHESLTGPLCLPAL